jgi:amino acid transporter
MMHRPVTELEPWSPGFSSLSNFTELLYQISHSLVIFAFVVLIYYAWKRKLPWIILGWPLHILADIPTHSYSFYPTPFLWPLVNVKFDGFSWGSGHFTLYNYLALALVYLGLYLLLKWRRRGINTP